MDRNGNGLGNQVFSIPVSYHMARGLNQSFGEPNTGNDSPTLSGYDPNTFFIEELSGKKAHKLASSLFNMGGDN